MLFKNLFISFTALMLLSFSLNVAAQKGKTKSVIGHINPFDIDFIPKTIKINSTIKFKINNVNTFKVNGFTSSNSLNIDFDVPPVFTDLIKENSKKDNEVDSKNKTIELTSIESAVKKEKFNLIRSEGFLNEFASQKENNHLKDSLNKLKKEIQTSKNNIDSLTKLLAEYKSQKIKNDSAIFKISINNSSSY